MTKPIASTGIILERDGKILLGRRKSKHGQGSWGPPGGKLDYFEKLEECAIRETFEETGLKIKNLKLITVTDNLFEDEKIHSISVMYSAVVIRDEEPKVMEPDKVFEWKWFEKKELPVPLFLPIQIMKDDGFFD